jgi:hypothetical protein
MAEEEDIRRCGGQPVSDYKVMFTVYQLYYDRIAEGRKTVEVRKATKRWRAVANHVEAAKWWGLKSEAVFVCGRNVHRRYITGAKLVDEMLLFELGEAVPRASC